MVLVQSIPGLKQVFAFRNSDLFYTFSDEAAGYLEGSS
jgi:hypothetical protein